MTAYQAYMAKQIAEEIKAIEEKYAQAALRAKKAGFDGVEIHAVGYYLGQQFLSKTANAFCKSITSDSSIIGVIIYICLPSLI